MTTQLERYYILKTNFGIFLSQFCRVAIFLVSVSIYLHSQFPITKKSEEAVVEKASEAASKKKVQ